MPHPPEPTEHKQPGLLLAVLDTHFQTFVTPRLVTWIYRGCLAVITLATLWFFLLALWLWSLHSLWLWGSFGLVIAPVIGAVLILITRVACELVLVRFHRFHRPPK